MTKLLLAAALTAVATPAFAEPIVLERDDARYVYTVKETRGIIRIEGVETKSRQPFSLRVTRRGVDGTVNGAPVRFKLSEVQRSPAEIASR